MSLGKLDLRALVPLTRANVQFQVTCYSAMYDERPDELLTCIARLVT